MKRLLVPVWIAALAAGCYSPHISECSITCGAGATCPSDTTCMSDGYCHVDIAMSCFPLGSDAAENHPADARVMPDARKGNDPDAHPEPDARKGNEPDARVPDAGTPDAGFPCTNSLGFVEASDAEDSLISNLSVEKNGNVHITYYDANRGMIRYAHRPAAGGDWQFEDVAPATDNLRGQTIDATGTLHVVFSDDVLFRPRLRYGRRLTSGPIGGWKFDTVDETAIAIDPTIAVDGSGGVHVAYWYLLSDLVYARRLGSATVFTPTPVDTEGTVGEHASIAISPSGAINVSYKIAGTRQDLGLATLRPDQANWNLARPDQTGNVGSYTSMAVDGAGGVHIAYADDSLTVLKYAYLPAQGPSVIIPVENALGMGHFNSLAVDGNGNVHISYYAYFEQNLRYAVKRAGQASFSARNLDTAGNVGRHSSLGVDGQNTVHISYIDDSNGDVKYTHICP